VDFNRKGDKKIRIAVKSYAYLKVIKTGSSAGADV